MRRFALTAASFLAFCTFAAGQQPLPPGPPAPVPVVEDPVAAVSSPRDPVKAGILVELDATRCRGEQVAWNLVVRTQLRPDGLPPAPVYFRVYEGGHKAAFASPDSGTFTFVVSVGSKSGQVATTQFDVVVGAPAPPPAPPTPPAPPGPPAPPEPKLVVELRDLVRADPDAQKPAHTAQIVAAWRKVAMSMPTDTSVKTFGDTLLKVRAEIKSVIPSDETMRPTRERIAVELDGTLGINPSTILTDDLRAKVRAAFNLVADSLEAASK